MEKTEQHEIERAAEAATAFMQELYPPPNERTTAEIHEDTKAVIKAIGAMEDQAAKKLVLRMIGDDDGILTDLIVAVTLTRLADEVAILKEELKAVPMSLRIGKSRGLR
jgi:hypothetical protein